MSSATQYSQLYPSQNISFSNPSSFSQLPPSQQNFVIPNHISVDETIFPTSQHFQTSQGGRSLPNFNSSYHTRAPSVEGDDANEEEENDENNAEGGESQVEKGQRKYWSEAEEEVLVKSWLQVSTDKFQNTKQNGETFWGRITNMYEQVRVYRNKMWAERAEGMRETDLLKERELDPLRSRWKRINASVSKFVGAFAQAESRRKSGECDDDVMKTAYAIYKSDNKPHHRDFNDRHCWEILKSCDVWKPYGDIVNKCKKKATTQESGSKRWRINETGNYSTSTDPNTPTSGDIGCSVQTPSDGSTKNKGKGKVVNMPSEAFQQWVDNIEKINLSKNLETEMELTRLKYERESQIERLKFEREAQNERVLLENRKVSMKQRKINLELFKVLASKDYLTEEEENLKSHLVKVLFP
ncbi:glutathione S-transferase T3-like [Beta vulgaris subsp. vulgaris]|uniref:glutathione S-transferase T3-like n=2 Tax=Beta vulgaris subsp. vulgaris TaxID=3555 RepID=UPI000900EF2E|nr:glutathione S-transferase T3-like [Beta vulgaris subsp. vulgaris]XP_048501556.1 glutathione S-transferase T3-like [Beta vulgaris subsp. vulgaris]